MSEIEKQFFETFGIEPIRYKRNIDDNAMFLDKVYPKITDHILLELICLNDIYLWLVHLNTVDELKNILLGKYIEHVNLMADENEKQEYIHQVQTIFKKE